MHTLIAALFAAQRMIHRDGSEQVMTTTTDGTVENEELKQKNKKKKIKQNH